MIEDIHFLSNFTLEGSKYIRYSLVGFDITRVSHSGHLSLRWQYLSVISFHGEENSSRKRCVCQNIVSGINLHILCVNNIRLSFNVLEEELNTKFQCFLVFVHLFLSDDLVTLFMN